MSTRVVVIDDEPTMAEAMAEVLRRRRYEVETFDSGVRALQSMHEAPALVVTDLRMPGMSGRDLAAAVRERFPSVPVIVITAFATVESAVECVRSGAVDYLMKPFAPDALIQAVERWILPERRERRSTEAIAVDPLSRELLKIARRAARSDATVLLQGESGSGKEVVAREIHAASPRAHGPFVAINCAALPRELLEAELFGHKRGAFTGATQDRKGYFRSADGGTLMLDEIGDMPPELQAKLLRTIQERRVSPLGQDESVPVDVRVIAATHGDLGRAVAEGRFRQDLYYRLSVLPIVVPPLRDRPLDIEPLARAFAADLGDGATLTDAAIVALQAHDWPGNVRELQNVIQRAAVLNEQRRIDAADVVIESAPASTASAAADPLSLDDAERVTIERCLARTGGNRSRAASLLGISPRTLRHKLKQYRDRGEPLSVEVAG